MRVSFRCTWRNLRQASVATVLCAGICIPFCAEAGPPPWGPVGYGYYATNQSLSEVLSQFAASFSLALEISPQVVGMVNGRFDEKSPSDFLDRLGGVYGFTWFSHAGTLFISRSSEMVTRSFTASAPNISAMRKALTDLNILDPRFGWGELSAQGIVLVSGPPAYVKILFDTIEALPLVSGGLQVAVFRLKHASVSDRTVMYRNKEITTPGIAQIIRNLVAGKKDGIPYSEELDAIASTLRAPLSDSLKPADDISGLSLTENSKLKSAGKIGPSQATQEKVSIQADPRLNALIIQDAPDRLPIYRKLIEQLDVPTRLIEIEAMIIDVDSRRMDELGISWSGRRGEYASSFGNLTVSSGDVFLGKSPNGSVTAGALQGGTSLVVSGDFLVSRLRALESSGDATIQSRPSILTVDNIGALIDLSKTFYIRTQGERVATVTPVTASTTLRVTPHLIEGKSRQTVQLDVQIDDGSISQDTTVEGLPLVSTSTVSTQAVIGEGQTLLIGGYKTQQKDSGQTGIPVLSDIPILGALFSTRTARASFKERLFMIQPRIVSIEPSFVKQSTPFSDTDIPGNLETQKSEEQDFSSFTKSTSVRSFNGSGLSPMKEPIDNSFLIRQKSQNSLGFDGGLERDATLPALSLDEDLIFPEN